MKEVTEICPTALQFIVKKSDTNNNVTVGKVGEPYHFAPWYTALYLTRPTLFSLLLCGQKQLLGFFPTLRN